MILPENRLQLTERTNGSNYTLVSRRGNWCLYSRNHGSDYEIFKVRVHKAGKMFGRDYPVREAFPSDEEFGDDAWSIGGLGCKERALARFDEICNDLQIPPDEGKIATIIPKPISDTPIQENTVPIHPNAS